MPRRERVRLLLRGLAKLLAVVVVAGAVGAGVGVGLATLTGDDDGPEPAALDTGSTTAATTPATTSVSDATVTSTTPQATASTPLAKLRVRVLGTVLHPASTPSGMRRKRARVAVRVRAENTGTTTVTLARPTLTAAGASVKTDPAADAPNTTFDPFAPGETQAVTLRFETAGRLTARLTSDHNGQLRIAGRTLPVFATVGSPLRSSAQRDAGAAATTTALTTTTP